MPHALLALPLLLIGLLLGYFIPMPFLVAIGISAIFFMREVTQAEYRWMEAHGTMRAAMPGWIGLDVRLWDSHSLWANWGVPTLIALAVATGCVITV